MSRRRVLYILGWGRSGSTVLGNILGEVDGFFCAGELHYLWERRLSDVMAHERTHILIRARFGILNEMRYPAWVRDGYCDDVAVSG